MKKLPLKINQQGSILVFTAIGLTLFMGMAGLALDLSHTELNKTRLQNAVDAAALAGANTLNEQLSAITAPTAAQITSARNAATNAIISVFSANVGSNSQLNQTIPALVSGNIEFSDTLFGSDPGTSKPPLYVRVTSPTVSYSTWFMKVWGQNTTNVSTSAVAGISPQTNCADNLAPIMLCIQPGAAQNIGSNGLNDGSGTWGFDFDKRIQLNSGTSTTPGNFMFLDNGGNNSADVLEAEIAGSGKVPGLCIGSSTVGTNPGQNLNKAIDGINTRFGIYQGDFGSNGPQGQAAQTNYPSDTNKTCYDFALYSSTSHDSYLSGASGSTDPISPGGDPNCATHQNDHIAGNGRRELIVPITDCSTVQGNSVATVKDIGCLFLDVPADYAPKNKLYCSDAVTTPVSAVPGCTSNQAEISARLVRHCSISGFSSNTVSNTVFNLKTVQLYKNPGSNDS
ncbi:MAG: Tad domain-containing protein [Mucilaginibacter sp.]